MCVFVISVVFAHSKSTQSAKTNGKTQAKCRRKSKKKKNLDSKCQIKMQEHIVAHFVAIIQQSTQEIKQHRKKINKIEEIKMMKEKRTRVHLSNCKYTMANPRNEKCFLSVNSTYLISHLQFYFVCLACARVFVFFFAVWNFVSIFIWAIFSV